MRHWAPSVTLHPNASSLCFCLFLCSTSFCIPVTRICIFHLRLMSLAFGERKHIEHLLLLRTSQICVFRLLLFCAKGKEDRLWISLFSFVCLRFDAYFSLLFFCWFSLSRFCRRSRKLFGNAQFTKHWMHICIARCVSFIFRSLCSVSLLIVHVALHAD